MKVALIGAGCGVGSLTKEAEERISGAGLLIGSGRLLSVFGELAPDSAARAAEVRPERIKELLETSGEQAAVVLYSGDSGFYSGASALLSLLNEDIKIETTLLPGLSSVQVLASRLARPWQDWRLVSAHGAEADPLWEVTQGSPVCFLTAGAETVRQFCRIWTEAGLADLSVTVGEALGTAEEKIVLGTAAAFAERDFAPLNLLLAEAAPCSPWQGRAPGIPDDRFQREEGVPMTKREIRCQILSVLGLQQSDVCWDVGAGSGSVGIELALHGRAVYGVEREEKAFALARRNRETFAAWRLRLFRGEAPEILSSLPVPDVVFVGGHGGRLPEILRAVWGVSPRARVCVTAVALETLTEAMRLFQEAGIRPEICQIQASRGRKIGERHLLLANNPVFLISGAKG